MDTPFVFVNYDNPSQTKDRARRRIISAHIGRFHRNRSGPAQRQELNSQKLLAPRHDQDSFSTESNTSTGPLHVPPSRKPVRRGSRHSLREWQHNSRSQKELHRPPTPTRDIESLMPLLDYDLAQQQGRQTEAEEDEKGPRPPPFRHPGPLSLVGQGRIDPFATFAVDEDYTELHLSIDYGVQRFWPMVAPSRHSRSENHSARDFLIQMKTSSLSYYSYLIAITANFEWMHGENPRSDFHERLQLRNALELFRYIRNAIDGLKGPPSNELLGAVLVLGSNVPEKVLNRKHCTPSRFQSPMADIQILDQYGTVVFPATHWRALVDLVKLSGGINKIEQKDVAGCCQLGDLVEASKKSTPPDFEYCTIFGEDSIADSPRDCDTLLAGSNLSSCFLDPTLEIFESRGLHRTIRAVTQATVSLGTYLRSGSPSTDQPELLGLRNKAQWLSLNLQREPSEWETVEAITEEDELVFDILRITLLIYNNLVLFPLPPASGVDTRLSISLKTFIVAALLWWPAIWTVHPKLLLWALMLGGISDSKGLERQWFLERFSKLLKDQFSEYRRWSQIENCLTSCMWLGAVLNDEAISFWADSRISGA